ncbi:hypothetical protein ACHAXM_008348 [Skeletonema potamos]
MFLCGWWKRTTRTIELPVLHSFRNVSSPEAHHQTIRQYQNAVDGQDWRDAAVYVPTILLQRSLAAANYALPEVSFPQEAANG